MPKAYPSKTYYVGLTDNESTIKIDVNTISPAVAIPAAIIYFASAFQIGYFSSIGKEFLSLVGPGDWLFALGIILFPMSVTWPLIMGAFETVRDQVKAGRFHDGRLYKLTQLVLRIPLWLLFAIAFALALNGIGKYYWMVHLAILSSLTVLCMGLIVELGEIYSHFERVRFYDVMKLVVWLGFLVIGVGSFYAENIAGRECAIVISDGRFDRGLYLRSVGEGHLIRLGSRTYFIPKDKVKEIFCGEFVPKT